MSLQSMTGYGEGQATGRGIRVEVELCSVNRRQFEARVSLPRHLTVLEARVTEHIQKRIPRGAVNGSVRVRMKEQAQRPILNSRLAMAYANILRQVSKTYGLNNEISAAEFLQLPDIIIRDDDEIDAGNLWNPIRSALDQALDHLISMRKQEGFTLQVDVRRRLALLKRILAGIVHLAPKVKTRYGQSLRDRLAQAGIKLETADERLLKELALFAERCDICEEIVRLKSHFEQAEKMLQGKEPAGRPLDFLCQEMFREINTIGSKANDARLSVRVVEFKTELERMREQIQNVE